MERRSFLTGMALAAATAAMASPAFAAMPAGVDQEHFNNTTKVGSMSLAASRMAVMRAQHPKVMEFAKFEVAEQETISNVLMTMKKGDDTIDGTVPKPSDAEVMAHVDEKGKKDLAKLKATANGAAFDKAYVMAQIQGHEMLLTIQEKLLKKGGLREQVNAAKLAKGMIKEHLTLLNDIKKALA